MMTGLMVALCADGDARTIVIRLTMAMVTVMIDVMFCLDNGCVSITALWWR